MVFHREDASMIAVAVCLYGVAAVVVKLLALNTAQEILALC